MMKIFIDNQPVDTDAHTSVSISIEVASLTDMDRARTGYSKTILLPVTTRNRCVIGDADQPNSAVFFNKSPHKARIEKDGFVVLEGTPYLASCDSGGTSGYYRITIIGTGKEWARQAARTTVSTLPVDFSERISAYTVRKSWTWDKSVRFLPVQRDRFEVENPSSNLFPPVKALTFEDYHPFLHVRTLLETLFAEAGYGIESSFLTGEYFGSLYISGNYPKKNVDAVRSLLDFRAGRFAAIETTADIYGRVYADPSQSISSLGNIVDTADPSAKSGGISIDRVFTNGGYFGKDNTRVMLSTPKDVTVGFEYHLFYTTDYYIATRDRLSGFSLVNLGDGVNRLINIANRNTDRREEVRANRSYIAIIFEHNPTSSYQLRYDEVTNPAADPENILPTDITTRTYATYSSRVRNVTISSAGEIRNPQMYEKCKGSSQYVLCGSDWALYDGYVTERGRKDVELTIRSSPERILPSRPKCFDAISFGGAEPGMKFTLGNKTTVRPVFAEYPGEGTTVGFKDVAAHEISCLELINALRQMFNLWFFTDHLSKRVFIEPRDRFHASYPLVDWSERIDFSKPVVLHELGADMPRRITFRYSTGDGAVSRWNSTNGQILGKWSADIANGFSGTAEATLENLFNPSLNIYGTFPDAPAASLLQAGEREHSAVRSEDLNFPIKVVRYLGMSPLPKGQHWGWPSADGSFPLIAFHHVGTGTIDPSMTESDSPAKAMLNGFTLGFEDRDGNCGLHRYRDSDVVLYNNSRRLEVYLSLGPEDVEPFILPNQMRHDFRARFRIELDGEAAFYRLEQICDYNPATNRPTRCVFIKVS